MADHQFPEGTTTPQDFDLKDGGVAIPLTGATVSIVATDRNGTAVAFTGTFSVFDADAGTARYTPDDATPDFTRASSPYEFVWKIIDALSDVSFVPNQNTPDRWIVGEVP